MLSALRLIKPALPYLPSYKIALERGWSPDNLQPLVTARHELAKIAADPTGFIATLDQVTGRDALPDMTGVMITLPDGSRAQKLPGYRRWLWDGEFCGSIGFRWQPGTTALPPHVLGHIGYAVVPWKRHKGYATEALRRLLPEVKAWGLDYVELTTEPENIASRKVIEANGGVLAESFMPLPAYGNGEKLRYRIMTRRTA